LYDEAGLDPMKAQAVVKPSLCQLDESGAVLRRVVRVKRKYHIAFGRRDSDLRGPRALDEVAKFFPCGGGL
jgi:hypothetical protein